MGDSYEQAFGLQGRAFEPAPDPRFHFPSLTQRKAMSAVSFALNRGAGMAAITGATGLGKSLLLAHLADQLTGQPVTLAWLNGSDGPLTARAAEAFGLAPSEDASHALAALDAFLREEARRGQRSLLLIDRCQDLPDEAAADLAEMAGLHYGERNLLQIVLTGDETFSQRLSENTRWTGVRGRIVASHRCEPLLRDELEPYLRHRLLCVGWQGVPALDTGLARLLHDATGGVPAAVNRAMSMLLDEAAAGGAQAIAGAALASWIDGAQADEAEAEYEIVEGDEMFPPGPALAEAQIEAIEHAFAEHGRMLGRLRREVTEMRERPEKQEEPAAATDAQERFTAIEARLDQHEQALRHMLERLIVYFESAGPGAG